MIGHTVSSSFRLLQKIIPNITQLISTPIAWFLRRDLCDIQHDRNISVRPVFIPIIYHILDRFSFSLGRKGTYYWNYLLAYCESDPQVKNGTLGLPVPDHMDFVCCLDAAPVICANPEASWIDLICVTGGPINLMAQRFKLCDIIPGSLRVFGCCFADWTNQIDLHVYPFWRLIFFQG